MNQKSEIKKAIFENLLHVIDIRTVTGSQIQDANFQIDLKKKIKAHLHTTHKDHEHDDRLLDDVIREALGLGPIDLLLQDEDISEIMVNGHQEIFVEHLGQIKQTNFSFISDESLLSVIKRIISPLGRRIDESSPMVDARLSDGSRINAIIPPVSLIGPVVTIRKFQKKNLTLENLVEKSSLSLSSAIFLDFCVRQKKNILIAGGTGSGKTTFLNAVSKSIGKNERVVTIEDAAELKLNQKHVISLETRPSNIENKGQVSIRDLLKNALRMRPDRIIVGECRGQEALDMLQAMNTGHDGSLTTLHANSPRDALSRLETMILMAGFDLPLKAIRDQISSAVDLIVYVHRNSAGKRFVTHITEVSRTEGEVVLTQNIFETNKTTKELCFTNQQPNFFSELSQENLTKGRAILFGDSLCS